MASAIDLTDPDSRGSSLRTPSGFDLQGIVPWGRRLEEYRAFFDLGEVSPTRWGRVLDVGGGPASFTAEAVARGLPVVAADPLYRLGGQSIRGRFEAARPALMQGLRGQRERFAWSHYASPEDVERRRVEALEIFLEDYDWGKACGRYRDAALPHLPFQEGSFRLALCSHLLFLYSGDLDEAFHLAALRELLRVAHEVRVFPLLTLEGRPSPHLPGLLKALCRDGVAAELVKVPFEFQKGATEMLRLWV